MKLASTRATAKFAKAVQVAIQTEYFANNDLEAAGDLLAITLRGGFLAAKEATATARLLLNQGTVHSWAARLHENSEEVNAKLAREELAARLAVQRATEIRDKLKAAWKEAREDNERNEYN